MSVPPQPPPTPQAELKVWTRNRDDEENWQLQLTTDDYDEALEKAQHLGHGDTISTVYEFGVFTLDGELLADQILCWWSENAHEEMGGPPQGRGQGWTEQDDRHVHYEAAGSTEIALRDELLLEEQEEEPSPRYRMIYCDECGLEMPQNEAHSVTEDVETGHSSATYSVSASRSHRSASRSWSNTSRQGVSRRSGRKYYKRVTSLLCEKCFRKQEADAAEGREEGSGCLWSFMIILVIATILFAIILATRYIYA